MARWKLISQLRSLVFCKGKIPNAALILGLMGTLPFILLSISAHLVNNLNLHHSILFALNTYSVIILSFLGGIYWGVIMCNSEKLYLRIRFGRHLCFSVIPSLVGWSSFLLDPMDAVDVLSVMFLIVLYSDLVLIRKELVPDWYLKLRFLLTGIVLSSLIVSRMSNG